MMNILTWLIVHRTTATKWFTGLAMALILAWSANTHIQNKKLSESLEMA